MSVGSWATLPHARTRAEPNRERVGFGTCVPTTYGHECSSVHLALWPATFWILFFIYFLSISKYNLGECSSGVQTREARPRRIWTQEFNHGVMFEAVLGVLREWPPRHDIHKWPWSSGLTGSMWYRVVPEWLLALREATRNVTSWAYFKRSQTWS